LRDVVPYVADCFIPSVVDVLLDDTDVEAVGQRVEDDAVDEEIIAEADSVVLSMIILAWQRELWVADTFAQDELLKLLVAKIMFHKASIMIINNTSNEEHVSGLVIGNEITNVVCEVHDAAVLAVNLVV